MTYRLQYEESFSLVNADEASIPKKKYGPFRYLYEENFEKGYWFPISCSVTFWLYGGACWLYLLPSDGDKAALEAHATQKLDQLIGDKMKRADSDHHIWNLNKVNRHLPPRLRLFDPSGQTILRGEAEEIQSVSEGFWVKTSDDAWDSEKETSSPAQDQVMIDHPDRTDYDETYSYQSLQLSYLSGHARVRSDITEGGLTSTIASGSVDHTIYEFRTRMLPPNGWFWSFSPTLRSQHLIIKDFESYLPLFESEDSLDIPIVISDPATQQVNAKFVNEYGVGLRSYGVLVGGGYSRHFKVKNGSDFWSFNAAGWASAVDYLQTEVEFQNRKIEKSYFAFLKTYRFDFDAFYNILPFRLALGFHWQYMVFPNIKMPDDMEFRGPARFNPEKNVFERPRFFIDSLDFKSTTFGLSLSYIYKDLSF